MSNAEHLIENAIVCLRDDKDITEFTKAQINIDIVKVSFPDCNIENVLDQIWEMANEVCFSWFLTETFDEQHKKKE